MNNFIEFEKGKYGLKAIIKTTWQDSFLNILVDENIVELELNIGKGWRRGNQQHLIFLEYLPNLKSLDILDLSIESIESIHYLKNLKSINISTYCKTKIDFNNFPLLEDCFIEWRKGCNSLFDCKNLKILGINKYKEIDSNLFSNLINLEKLTLLNSTVINLDGVFELKNLNYLSIGVLNRLESLKGIEKLQTLERLEIQKCKNIHSVIQIFQLKKLKIFFLIDSGNIESIKGIENLTELDKFMFYESTNIEDGNLKPLFELKKLTDISFQNRRHYTHTREEFGKLYR